VFIAFIISLEADVDVCKSEIQCSSTEYFSKNKIKYTTYKLIFVKIKKVIKII